MAATANAHEVAESVPIDIPSSRVYETEANAELDRKLCASIEAAQEAENEYLAQLLAQELGSHYFETR